MIQKAINITIDETSQTDSFISVSVSVSNSPTTTTTQPTNTIDMLFGSSNLLLYTTSGLIINEIETIDTPWAETEPTNTITNILTRSLTKEKTIKKKKRKF